MRPKLYIFDLDGTLYRGSEAIPFAVEVLAKLRNQGAKVRFLTNNSSQTRYRLAEKLDSLGFEVSVDEVYTSAMGAARWLHEKGISKVFVVGEEGLASTLKEHGIASVDENPSAVVVGICRSFTYDWMNRALQHLVAGAILVATNADSTYPLEQGRVQPGAGAIVASIAECSGIEPVAIGKPQPQMIHLILGDAEISPSETLIVGDRMDTDIAAGRAAGCATLLVGTGVTRQCPEGQPFCEDLRALLAE